MVPPLQVEPPPSFGSTSRRDGWLSPVPEEAHESDSRSCAGAWRHLLVADRSPRRFFAAKALASLTVIMLLVVGLAASGVVGGLAAVGNGPLVGLDGHLLAPQ